MKPEDLVGRGRELDELRGAVDRMLSGDFTVALVEGGPCSGKGAVMNAIEAYARTKGAAVLHGVCRGWPLPEPYQAISEAINQALRDRSESRSFPECMFPMPAAGSERIDVSRSKSSVGPTLEAIWKFMKETVGDRPLLLSINNFHWADPATCRFLGFLSGLNEKRRLMLVLAYRPEELSDGPNPARTLEHLMASHPVHKVILGHLYQQELSLLIEKVLGIKPPDELLRHIAKESGGVPAHVIWMVRHLSRTGVIDGKTGKWTGEAPGPKSNPIPSLREMIRGAVASLPQPAGDLLKAISVVGWSATGTILEDVLDVGVDEIGALGRTLEEAGFVTVSDKGGELVLRFNEGLARESIYDNLRSEDRRRLHWRTGNAVEKLLLGMPEGSLFILAHHFSNTGDIGKALEYVTLAGDMAAEMAAYEEALAHYEQALTILEWEDESQEKKVGELRLLARLGAACYALGFPERSLEFHARALKIAAEAKDGPRMAESRVRMGEAYLEMGEWALGLAELKRGLAAAEEAKDQRTALLARISLAGAYCRREVYHKGIEYMEKVRKEQLADSELKRRAAQVWLDIGAHVLEGSRRFIESAQELFRKLGDTECDAVCKAELVKLTPH